MADPNIRLTFGRCPAGVTCEDRRAAYAVILDPLGRVAVVDAGNRWFLPGGGSLAGESPEVTVLREIQEECGCRARILGQLGEALQYFRDATRWYKMVATFYRAEFEGAPSGSAEHELVWLEPGDMGGFFHQCHEWAVTRAREAT